LTDGERRATEQLLPRYNDPVWNLGDPFAGSTT